MGLTVCTNATTDVTLTADLLSSVGVESDSFLSQSVGDIASLDCSNMGMSAGAIGSFDTNYPYYTSPNYIFSTPALHNTVEVNGDGADVLINGKSLKVFMEGVENRLSILQPDPKKLEKYEALRKAYEHYKLLEKLIGED